MKQLNINNPFQIGKNTGKPKKLIFTCNCRTLKDVRELRAEINFTVRKMGYKSSKDFTCEIKELKK